MPITRVAVDNIIRISSRKPIGTYFESILIRAQPRIYNKYNEIKIRCTKDLRKDIMYMCQMLWHVGLIIPREEGIKRISEKLQVARGELLDEVYEIKLKKIPAIIFEDNSDYEDYMRSLWDKW